MLLCVCSVIERRGRQTVVRPSVTHSAIASCATWLGKGFSFLASKKFANYERKGLFHKVHSLMKD